MEKITCEEAAYKKGVSVRRMQQLCKLGLIDGAAKVGKTWLIPEVEEPVYYIHDINYLPLPIGISSYIEAVTKYYYVDKTMMIAEILSSRTKVSLFTRPRRFGKTLTMDMLRVFFEKTNNDTSIYFKDKQIASFGEYYMSYQGQYPVIFLTFKDLKCLTWNQTLEKLKKIIAAEFRRHVELKESKYLDQFEIKQYNLICNEEGSNIDYEMALGILSKLLEKHYNKQCVIIIDEYDTPISEGYYSGYYNEIISFMRNFFSGGLKDNSSLAFGFLTGILRTSKESIFSGLNNIKINTILDNQYSNFFGFTKEEVYDMLKHYGLDKKLEEVCNWYDGYKFGNTEIFNPWSVINYIDNLGKPKAYWQSTGSNEIIQDIINNASDDITNKLFYLMTGKVISTYIDTNIVYPDILKNPYNIFSFLLLTGYLKVSSINSLEDENYMCDVVIPNKEISYIYSKEIINKIGRSNAAVELQQAIFNHDVDKLQSVIQEFLIDTISIYDGTNESFYQGVLLGLCALVNNRYLVNSNIESGYGRLDIELKPINKYDPGFIFELKYAKNELDLDKYADTALEQIETKRYDQNLKKRNIKNIIKVGIAFSGKKAIVKNKK